MPIYEYVCERCNKHFEIMQKITEEPLTICSDCEGQLRKMISNTSFVLKGTGWYVTDYAQNKNSCATNGAPAQKQKDSSSTPKETAASTETAAKAKEPAASTK